MQQADSKLLFHAELDDHTHPENSSPSRKYQDFLGSRPETFEISAIDLITNLQSQNPTLPMHIVHLSASDALPRIQAVRKKGLPLSVETCFHYRVLPLEFRARLADLGTWPVCLNSDQVPEGRTDFKCCPPIRNNSNRERLWEALLAGDIDFVISDHSPCVAELKGLDTGDFNKAWGGIGGLGLGLSLMYTEAQRRGIGLCKLMTWLASNPAKQLGISGKKGSLCAGADGDFVLFDPNAKFKVIALLPPVYLR